jgi:hypothetical protein
MSLNFYFYRENCWDINQGNLFESFLWLNIVLIEKIFISIVSFWKKNIIYWEFNLYILAFFYSILLIIMKIIAPF